MKVFNPEYINIFPDELRQIGKELKPVYEMSTSLADYKDYAEGHAFVLYRHIIYVTVLGNLLPGYLVHWKDEIRTYAFPMITKTFSKKASGTKRSRIIRKHMMEPQMGVSFESYYESQFISALDIELIKGNKMLNDPRLKRDRKSIEHALKIIRGVMDNIADVPEKCKEEIQKFYEKFCEAADVATNPNKIGLAQTMLDEAIDELSPVIR